MIIVKNVLFSLGYALGLVVSIYATSSVFVMLIFNDKINLQKLYNDINIEIELFSIALLTLLFFISIQTSNNNE